MKKIFIILAMIALLFSCTNEKKESGLEGSIKVAGSSTVYPITMAVAEEFSKVHPKVEIAIQSTGTGGGFANFFSTGKTDINNASREIKEIEVENSKESGVTPIKFEVATDGIVFVVNKDNPAKEITKEQLKEIWRPNNPAQKWSDIDSSWLDEDFELYGPTSASGTFDFFTEHVIGESGASRSDYQGTEQDNTIITAVSGDKAALGYLGLAYYLENKSEVDSLAVNGVKPTMETVGSGEYSILSRPLFIYVSKESLQEKEIVREFIRFYLEKIKTDLVKDVGYVPINSNEKQLNKFNSIVD